MNNLDKEINNAQKNELYDIKNRKDIELLVADFYEKLMEVKELSYYFTTVINVDMKTHTTIMVNFWENILFHTGYYDCNPLEKHKNLNSIQKVERDAYKIWIELFNDSVDRLFKGKNADIVKERAKMVAQVMQNNIG